MKILRVITSMDPDTGGPCQGIRNSIPELKRLNIYCEVVCLDDASSTFLGKDSFRIHALGKGKGPWCYNPRLLPWLKENLERFDVVIIHGLWLYPSYAAIKAIKYLKRKSASVRRVNKVPKLYVMPHGMLDPYFQRASNRKIKAIRNWVYWKLIENKVINEADGVLFTCQEELILAREPFRPYHPKCEVNIGYGIDGPAPFNGQMRNAFYEKCPQVAARPYLLFLSRIHSKKGVELLIKAYASVLRESSKSNEKLPLLVIAGPGRETTYGQKMQEIVAEDPILHSNVFFPGMLTGIAKWGAFYGCEAFILPSHQENFGIAVVEALACSKPVLISSQVNIWREIEAARGGLVAGDTSEGTMSLLENWKQMSPAERQRMGIRARDCFESNFTSAPAAKKLVNAMSGVISN